MSPDEVNAKGLGSFAADMVNGALHPLATPSCYTYRPPALAMLLGLVWN